MIIATCFPGNDGSFVWGSAEKFALASVRSNAAKDEADRSHDRGRDIRVRDF